MPTPNPPRPLSEELRRAAKLSRVPAVTMARAAERFGVAESSVQRARDEHPEETALTLHDLLLAALTHDGTLQAGEIVDLVSLATWIDHVNHDGCTTDHVSRMLDALARAGVISLDGTRWRLLKPWP